MGADTPLVPGASSFAAAPAAVEETHISVVILVGDRVFKLKKPIELPFLDWRSRETRREVCHREVELNRRLAPDVYLGVADVLGDDGVPCDHLVVMRRMPPARRLSRLVREGVDVRASVGQVAALVATFHAGAERSPLTVDAASRDSVLRNWEDNLATLQKFAGDVLDGDLVARVDRLAHAYLAGRGPLFDERGRAGCAVDGHGDLLADDIYLLDDGPRVLDCLEFSDRLRAVDVLDDIAFLAMDLERLGAPDLARHLLDSYARHSGEAHPATLAHHYIAYRAGVRCKIACLRAEQGVPAAVDEARQLLALAAAHLESARVRLVLVGGLPGTGKSTLASAVAHRTGWHVLRSDVIRKELLGVDPSTSLAADYEEGIYRPDHTVATYEELLARARHLLERGESVILDASWSATRWRDEALAMARATSSEHVALRCDSPPAMAARRLLARSRYDASDATPGVAAELAASAAPWPEAFTVDTAGTPDDSVAAALRILAGIDPN